MIMQQSDSTAYSFESGDESMEQTTFHRPQTPYQAIRMLPATATPAEQDEIVQKYFKPVIVDPSHRPDTLSLPGLKSVGKKISDLPTYKDGFFKGNQYLHPEVRVTLNGIPGDPVPYSLRSDVFVTFTLLLKFFCGDVYFCTLTSCCDNASKKFFLQSRSRANIYLEV